MEIRMLKPDEVVQLNMLSSVCFVYEYKDYEDDLKEPSEHSEGYERSLGGFDEHGNMICGLQMIPFEMNFDGHTVKMCGIGGVVTAPEARGTGAMGKVFAECLRMMREQGYLFSTLYPFSYAYYRKSGYELAYSKRTTTVPMSCFRKYPYPKDTKVKPWKKGDDPSDLKAIYDKFREGRNYAIKRDDNSWKEISERAEPYKKLFYTYIHYDSDGKPDSYLMFKASKLDEDHGKIINISELAWTTKEGLYAMFGFIGGLSPSFSEIKWDVPYDLDLGSMFPEGWDVATHCHTSIMTRIMDVSAVLNLLKAPITQSGKVAIKVVDKSMPCNDGIYSISWENGNLNAEKVSTEISPDMSTSVEALAQLVIGYANPDIAQYRQDTTIHGNREALDALFAKKNLYLWESF